MVRVKWRAVIAVAAGCAVAAIMAAQPYFSDPVKSRYLRECTTSGELILAKNYKQNQYLLELGEPRSGALAHEAAERDVWRESSRDPAEYEDHRPRLAGLEAAGSRVVRNLGRLTCIDPVLEKIEDGTYRFSDVTGRLIQERLERVPNVISTSDEEQVVEPDLERERIL